MIQPWQIRSAREALSWSQGQLAKKAGSTQPYISDLEKGRIENPSVKTIEAIENAFKTEGLYFQPDGIQWRKTNSYIIEGSDCYLRLLDDIHETLGETKSEWLLSASDDSRCNEEVIVKTKAIRASGITMRSLIKNNDTFLLGPPSEYRWMPDSLFAEGDVKIIYADRVAYLVTWTKIPRVIVIQDKVIAEENRRIFDFIWNMSDKPAKSTAPIRYEGKK